MPILGTDRLVLRPYRVEDFDAVHAYARRIESCRFMGWGPNEPSDTRKFITRSILRGAAHPREDHELAVIRRRDHRLIGGIGISVKDAPNRYAEIGYVFAPEEWGRGYATEAARTLLDFGFRDSGLHRIGARVDPDNAPSIHVLEKLGMRREGLLVRAHLVRGVWRDHLLYAMTEDEWTPRPAD